MSVPLSRKGMGIPTSCSPLPSTLMASRSRRLRHLVVSPPPAVNFAIFTTGKCVIVPCYAMSLCDNKVSMCLSV